MDILGIKENIMRAILPEAHSKPPTKPEQAQGDPHAESPKIPENLSPANEEKVKALTESINQVMQINRYSLQFVPDKEAGRVVIKVLDAEGNLIRQIPPEALLGVSDKIGDGIGIVVNKTLE